MGTFMAFLVAIAKLFYAQPWSKIAIFGLAVFVGGCVVGVKLTRSVAREPRAEPRQPERVYPLRPWKAAEAEPKPAEVYIDETTDIPNNPLKPLTDKEFEQLKDTLRKPEPKASTVCVGGNCSTGSRAKVQARPQRRRLFGWR